MKIVNDKKAGEKWTVSAGALDMFLYLWEKNKLMNSEEVMRVTGLRNIIDHVSVEDMKAAISEAVKENRGPFVVSHGTDAVGVCTFEFIAKPKS